MSRTSELQHIGVVRGWTIGVGASLLVHGVLFILAGPLSPGDLRRRPKGGVPEERRAKEPPKAGPLSPGRIGVHPVNTHDDTIVLVEIAPSAAVPSAHIDDIAGSRDVATKKSVRRTRRGRAKARRGTNATPSGKVLVPTAPDTSDTDAEAAMEAKRRMAGGGVTAPGPLPSVRIEPPAPALVLGPRRKTGSREVIDIDALEPDGGGAYVTREGSAVGHIAPDGTITFEERSAVAKASEIGWGLFLLNPLPLLNAAAGNDTEAPAKLAMMQKTCAMRLEMRKKADAENLGRALNELRPRLEAIWGDPRRTARERRHEIFTIWDGCADREDRMGDTARAIVVAFVVETIPVGHPDAYLPEELTRLNDKRTSLAAFSPYVIR